MHPNLEKLSILRSASIRDAITKMDVTRVGIIIVLDQAERLVGTVTDGDLRRATLANIDFDEPVGVLLDRKSGSMHASPITAPADTDRGSLLKILQQHSIRHLPLTDSDQKFVGLVTQDEFVPKEMASVQALLMAGGQGNRLRPLTETLPKPMLPMGERPLLEIIVQQLRMAGINRINLAVHHESEKITQHFGDGSEFGVSISYVTEDRPLGTAGALGLMEIPRETTLVMNGDILTQVDFQAMLDFHRECRADLTVAVQRHEMKIPYGVLECEGTVVKGIAEKPDFNFFLNAGMYLLEPPVYGFIPAGEPYDMTDLIQHLLDEGRAVAAFPVLEYWIDIGAPEEYQRAQEFVKNQQANK